MLDERRPVHLPRSLSMLVMVRAVKQRHIPNPARAPGLSTLSETRGSAPPQVNTHPLCPFLLSWTRGLSGGERQCQTWQGGCPASPGGAPLSSLNPVMLPMDHLVDRLTDANVRLN